MNNLFYTSPEEKDRIRQLHESYKNVHGTTSLLKEQGSDRTLQGVVKDKKTKEVLTGTNVFITERPGESKTGTAAVGAVAHPVPQWLRRHRDRFPVRGR